MGKEYNKKNQNILKKENRNMYYSNVIAKVTRAALLLGKIKSSSGNFPDTDKFD